MVGPKSKEAPREEKKVPATEKKPETPVTDGRQTMLYFLGRDIPDWRQINVDPEFIKSLEVPDPLNPGQTRLQSINLAFEAADFTTVIGFFRDLQDSQGRRNHRQRSQGKPRREGKEGAFP